MKEYFFWMVRGFNETESIFESSNKALHERPIAGAIVVIPIGKTMLYLYWLSHQLFCSFYLLKIIKYNSYSCHKRNFINLIY